jgi:hypothetical protein
MNLYFGIKCVKEEILHLNKEIHHLLTFMIDDHHDFYQAVTANIIQDLHLASELSCQWQHHQAIHLKIASHLHQTSCLHGFTGTLLPGVCEGHDGTPEVMPVGGLPSCAHKAFGFVKTYDKAEFDDKENHDDGNLEVVSDSDLVVQLLENIALQDSVNNGIHSD